MEKHPEVFGENYPSELEDVERRVLNGQTAETQQNFMFKSQPIFINVIRFPLRDSSGQITGICGIARELLNPTLNSIDQPIEITEYRLTL